MKMKNRIIGISVFLGVLLSFIAIYATFHKTPDVAQPEQIIQVPVPGDDYVEGDDEDHELEHADGDFDND
jgi:hypothetical protein